MKMTGHPGVIATTTYISPTTLDVSITVFKTAYVGTYSVNVTNPDGGTGSCPDCFTVTAGPTVTSISPATVRRGTTTTAVTITGTGFVLGAQVTPPTGVTFDRVAVIDATTITAAMTIAAKRAPSTNVPITVSNPASAGYGVGRCGCLTITA